MNISLIVPTWNSAPTIGTALDSALQQSAAPFEIIVVDDGSTDETVHTLAPYRDRVIYIRQENAGPAAARNRALQVATGDLFAFLDADDLFPPGALELLARTLEANPDLEIAQGQVQDFRQVNGDFIFRAPQRGVNLGSALFRRRVFENIGVFDEALRTGEDLDFWLRTREGGLNHQLLPAVTYFYRRRPVEAVGSISMHKAMIARVVKRSLERTRQLSK